MGDSVLSEDRVSEEASSLYFVPTGGRNYKKCSGQGMGGGWGCASVVLPGTLEDFLPRCVLL